jgi:hypothetical protein
VGTWEVKEQQLCVVSARKKGECLCAYREERMGKKSSLVAHRILSQRKLVPELHDDRGGGLCKEPTPSTDSCSKDVLHSELLPKKRDDEGGSKLGPIKEQQENAAHQQAILQSLAS